MDADGDVISFPPITNSEKTKVGPCVPVWGWGWFACRVTARGWDVPRARAARTELGVPVTLGGAPGAAVCTAVWPLPAFRRGHGLRVSLRCSCCCLTLDNSVVSEILLISF